MCGIVGYVNLSHNNPLDFNLLISMNDSISHRGPDGEGFYFCGDYNFDFINFIRKSRPNALISYQKHPRTLAFGHRRLAIIDLDPKAGQPMSDSNDKIWLVFNGEIYNYKEIRSLLKDKYKFKTDHSDTETIIYAYKEWGKNFIHHLRGMFAFVLWDSEKDLVLLYRDRTGIKPLYYTIHNGRFYFASEIKAFLQDETIVKELDEKNLYDYLTFLTVPAPNTLFKNIYKLKAGHYLEINQGLVSEQREYWDVFSNVNVLYHKSEDEIKHQLINELRSSVAIHLESDVPVGVFLSGGIDSSTNAALFKEVASHKVKAFCIGYKNDDHLITYKNEFKYSRLIAKKFDLEYYELELSQDDLIEFLPKLIYHQDEPIADPVCVPVYYVSKLAKDNGVTVAQVGEGSDELFCGYNRWLLFLLLQKLNSMPCPQVLKYFPLIVFDYYGKQNTVYYEYLRRGYNNERIFWSGAEAFFENEKKQLLSQRLREKFRNYSSYEIVKHYYKKFLQTAPEKSNLNWMSYIDLKIRLPELLLMRVDKMSMAVALEGRVPFLDYKFVEFAMSIPSKLKYKGNQTKYILKKAVEEILPYEIVYRKKQGFGTPVYEWFFDKLGILAKEKIKLFNKHTEILNDNYLEYLYNTNQGAKIWYLLNLANWWLDYINKYKYEN